MTETGVWTHEEAQSNHAFSPNLANAIASILDKNSNVVDIGCGNGAYIDHLVSNGFLEIEGYDGTEFDHELIKQHDFSKPLKLNEKAQIICLEVAEHIPVKFEKQFIDNLTKNSSGIIILSWAVPGQGGLGHVNEQTNRYVILKMRSRGFEIDAPLSEKLRSSVKHDPLWWFRNTLMVFKKAA